MDGYSSLCDAFNRRAQQLGWPIGCDPTLSYEAPTLRDALGVWRTAAAGRTLPLRADMAPRTMKTFLGEVALLDVVDAGGRVRFRSRVTGTTLALTFGSAPGRYLDEVVPQPFLDRWETMLRLALKARAPIRTNSRVEFGNQTWLNVESFYGPLGPEGARPDAILVVAHVSPAAHHQGAVEQVIPVQPLPGALER